MKKPAPFDHYATLPRSVRVGCFSMKVEVMTPRESSSGAEFGHCNFAETTIRVAPELSVMNLANTLLHETIHAVNWVYGIDDKSDEEQFTTQVANGLLGVWRDNPELIAWINLCTSQPDA